MTEPITLDFLGRQARVTRVLPGPSSFWPDLQVEPEVLTVVVDFEPAFNSTLSVYLPVPAKRYKREEFIEAVGVALRDWAREEKRKHYGEAGEKAEAKWLKALAAQVAADLGLEGPGA